MHKSIRCFLFASALALSACSSIPIGSMYKLSRIDFMTTDLRVFRFALTMPRELRPLSGGVHLDLAYAQGNQPEEKRVIKLQESKAPPDFVGLPNAPTGQKTYVYRLPPNEVATLNKIRMEAAASKLRGQKGSLSIGVAAKEFCAVTTIPKKALPVTTHILSSENSDYVMLTRDIDLRSDNSISTSLDKLEPCKE